MVQQSRTEIYLLFHNLYSRCSIADIDDRIALIKEQHSQEKDLLNERLKKLQGRFDTYRDETEKVYKLFTPNQLRRVTTGRRVNWTDEDVSTAMAIYSAGPKSYKLLRQKGHPYPAPSTLRKWARKVDIKPGAFLKPVLPLLQNKGDGDWSKYCVISFDEMKVKRCFEFDRAEKQILSPADFCLVFMVSGLFQKWQQVVYFGFRDDTSKMLWDLIIENVEKCGLIPIAAVCDMRGIIQSSLALKGLFNHLKTELNTKFILTRRLNQDILERMFGYLRAKGGGLHDHPSPLELKYRIRASIVGE